MKIGLFLHDPDRTHKVAEKLKSHPDLIVSAIAHSITDAQLAAKDTEIDASICGSEFMESAARARSATGRNSPNPARLFLTNKPTFGDVVRGVHTGFDNYLVEDDPVEKWVDTIHRTIDGTSSLKDNTLWNVAGEPVDMTTLRFEERSELERNIIELLSEGLTNDQIAELLHVSCQTVRNRVCRLMDDIGVSNRTMLSLAFRRSRVDWRTSEF